MTDTLNSIEIGHSAEDLACAYLIRQGLEFITRNYRCRMGEIDLIMRDKDEIVFVEVRFRTNSYFGSAIESINQTKQKKIIQTAYHYLNRYKLYDKVNCRFDVIGLSYAQAKAEIEWISDAFLSDEF